MYEYGKKRWRKTLWYASQMQSRAGNIKGMISASTNSELKNSEIKRVTVSKDNINEQTYIFNNSIKIHMFICMKNYCMSRRRGHITYL